MHCFPNHHAIAVKEAKDVKKRAGFNVAGVNCMLCNTLKSVLNHSLITLMYIKI